MTSSEANLRSLLREVLNAGIVCNESVNPIHLVTEKLEENDGDLVIRCEAALAEPAGPRIVSEEDILATILVHRSCNPDIPNLDFSLCVYPSPYMSSAGESPRLFVIPSAHQDGKFIPCDHRETFAEAIERIREKIETPATKLMRLRSELAAVQKQIAEQENASS